MVSDAQPEVGCPVPVLSLALPLHASVRLGGGSVHGCCLHSRVRERCAPVGFLLSRQAERPYQLPAASSISRSNLDQGQPCSSPTELNPHLTIPQLSPVIHHIQLVLSKRSPLGAAKPPSPSTAALSCTPVAVLPAAMQMQHVLMLSSSALTISPSTPFLAIQMHSTQREDMITCQVYKPLN